MIDGLFTGDKYNVHLQYQTFFSCISSTAGGVALAPSVFKKTQSMARKQFNRCAQMAYSLEQDCLLKDADNYYLRRDLSLCYISDCLPQARAQRHATCIEDCRESTLRDWLYTLDVEGLNCVINILDAVWQMLQNFLAKQLDLGKEFNVVYNEMYAPRPRSVRKSRLLEYCVYYCRFIKVVAVTSGVYNADSEAAKPYNYALIEA